VVAVLGTKGLCTGTLIAPDVVLTAGHCIEIDPLYVITHADSLEPGAPGEQLAVKWSRAYPDWEDRFDVGVVVLQRMARTKPRAIATACLANERLASGAPVTIVGYGLIAPDASDANTRLHAARLPVTDPYCERSPGCLRTAWPKGEFAGGGRGTDACYGDSGGPAYIETPSGFALAGVVSRGLAIDGLPCGNGGIFARADKVVAWIQSVTERKLERVGCNGPGDDPDETDAEVDASEGCAAQPGGGPGLLALVVLAVGLAVVLDLGPTSRRRRA
jgi:secreted trypsin-like serine protease